MRPLCTILSLPNGEKLSKIVKLPFESTSGTLQLCSVHCKATISTKDSRRAPKVPVKGACRRKKIITAYVTVESPDGAHAREVPVASFAIPMTTSSVGPATFAFCAAMDLRFQAETVGVRCGVIDIGDDGPAVENCSVEAVFHGVVSPIN
jgi:hypothetical protein